MTPHSLRQLVICSSFSCSLYAASAVAQQPAPPAAPAQPAPPAAPPPAAAAPPAAPAPAAPAPVAAPAAPPPAAAPPADPNPAPVQPPAGTTPEVPPAVPPPVVAEEAPLGAPAAPAEDPQEEKTFKKIDFAAWSRVAGVLSDVTGEELDDQSMNGVFEFHVWGQVHEYIKFTTNFIAGFNSNDNATAGANNGIAGNVSLLDGTIEFEPVEAFNIWIGRMLVPVDRSNFSGPWFMAPWNYPGFLQDGSVYAPLEGPNGRNDGATVWGQFDGGTFKYYLGAFDLHDVAQSPLFTGRLALSLLNPEPGFYSSSTYYGKDILAIGVAGQYKRDGSIDAGGGVEDYGEFNADILFEKDLGDAGVFDVEGAYHHFTGDNAAVKDGWFGLLSYLIPGEIGLGRMQPMVRVQQVLFADGGPDPSTMLDAQLGYVIDAYAARLALGYARTWSDAGDFNQLFLGAQIMK